MVPSLQQAALLLCGTSDFPCVAWDQVTRVPEWEARIWVIPEIQTLQFQASSPDDLGRDLETAILQSRQISQISCCYLLWEVGAFELFSCRSVLWNAWNWDLCWWAVKDSVQPPNFFQRCKRCKSNMPGSKQPGCFSPFHWKLDQSIPWLSAIIYKLFHVYLFIYL